MAWGKRRKVWGIFQIDGDLTKMKEGETKIKQK